VTLAPWCRSLSPVRACTSPAESTPRTPRTGRPLSAVTSSTSGIPAPGSGQFGTSHRFGHKTTTHTNTTRFAKARTSPPRPQPACMPPPPGEIPFAPPCPLILSICLSVRPPARPPACPPARPPICLGVGGARNATPTTRFRGTGAGPQEARGGRRRRAGALRRRLPHDSGKRGHRRHAGRACRQLAAGAAPLCAALPPAGSQRGGAGALHLRPGVRLGVRSLAALWRLSNGSLTASR
jgi:hypothetical protein